MSRGNKIPIWLIAEDEQLDKAYRAYRAYDIKIIIGDLPKKLSTSII